MHKLSEDAIRALMLHAWHGNVRELRNVIRQMAWKTQGLMVETHHLPPIFHKGWKATPSGTLDEQLVSAERSAIETTLQTANGTPLAARMLGIHRTALYKKMKRLGINLQRLGPNFS